MTSLRGIFVSESTFYEFMPCDLLKMFLFFKFIHSIKLGATWLRTHDFGRDDFRATWPVTFSYIFFKRLSCCRLNANFMLQMLKKLNCLWFAKKWILFPSNFFTWWLAWLAWLTGSTRMTRWLAGSQFVKTRRDPDFVGNTDTEAQFSVSYEDPFLFNWVIFKLWITRSVRNK